MRAVGWCCVWLEVLMLVQVSTDRLVSWPESSIILLFWVLCAGCISCFVVLVVLMPSCQSFHLLTPFFCPYWQGLSCSSSCPPTSSLACWLAAAVSAEPALPSVSWGTDAATISDGFLKAHDASYCLLYFKALCVSAEFSESS